MVIRVVIGGMFLLKVKRVQGSNASRSNAFGVQVLRRSNASRSCASRSINLYSMVLIQIICEVRIPLFSLIKQKSK